MNGWVKAKVKDRNSVDIYINNKIKKLKKEGNAILTQIHKLSKKPQANHFELIRLKIAKKEIQKQIKSAFASLVSKYWERRIKNISHINAKKMFLEINKIFRKKEKRYTIISMLIKAASRGAITIRRYYAITRVRKRRLSCYRAAHSAGGRRKINRQMERNEATFPVSGLKSKILE